MFETEDRHPTAVYYFHQPTGYWTMGFRQEDGMYAGELGGMTRDTVTWQAYHNGVESIVINTINQYLRECEEQGVEPEVPEPSEWDDEGVLNIFVNVGKDE